MRKLKESQIKGLSEFLNTVAAAWFSAGVVTPFFIGSGSRLIAIAVSIGEIIMSLFFLAGSLSLLRKVEL